MASRGNIVDEVAQEAEATNQNEGVQVAGAGSEREITNQESHGVWSSTYGMLQWVYEKCHWRGHQGVVDVLNQNESRSLMSRACDKLRQWRSRPVSQCSYMDGDPNVTSYKIIYRSIIERNTKDPYTVKFHDPTHIITGIACLPKDAETSSPEAEVVHGGVGCKEVEIMLTPVEKGDWACCIQINGIEDNCLEMNPNL